MWGLKLNYQLPTHQPPRSRPRPQFLNTSTPTLPQQTNGSFPKIGVPQNGWFILENLIEMDDLEIPLFLETPKSLFFSGCKVGHEVGYNIRFEELVLVELVGWLGHWWVVDRGCYIFLDTKKII